MRRSRRIAYVLLAATLLSVSALSPMKAMAGVSETVIDSSTLNESHWSNPEEDVYVEEGKLIFPDGSTEYSRYIAKSPAQKDENFENLVELTVDMNISKMPSGKSFIVGFGLSGIEALPSEAGNVEVAFTNQGGIKAGVTVYDEAEQAITIASPKACGVALNNAAKVSIVIGVDAQITVSVNGNTVCSGKLPVSGEGRIGFLQTGGVAAQLSNLRLVHYQYDTPENPNIDEDFEKGALDASRLTAKALEHRGFYPRGQVVEKYNDNYVLMFRNVAQSYVGTLYQYSNFEMTFDVPYIQAEDIYDDAGNVSLPGQKEFIISFGGEKADWDETGWASAREAIVFGRKSVCSYNDKKEIVKEYAEPYFTEKGGGFSVKVSVVDSVIYVGIKWTGEKAYEDLLSYKISGGNPLGYVHIWTSDTGQFAIDNLKITNLDVNGKVIDTEYQSGKWKDAVDYKYVEQERKYLNADTEGKDKAGFSWYVLIPVTLGIGVAALVTTALLVRQRDKKKEAKTDEK